MAKSTTRHRVQLRDNHAPIESRQPHLSVSTRRPGAGPLYGGHQETSGGRVPRIAHEGTLKDL